MRLVTGRDMFGDELGVADVLLVAGNSTIGADGRLVMGAGAARMARDMFPGLDADLGAELERRGQIGGRYGLMVMPEPPSCYAAGALAFIPDRNRTRLGVFQTKTDWRFDSSPALVAFSTALLLGLATALPNWRFAMNFPAIGKGNLSVRVVTPLIERLPHNVWVYRRDD